MANERLENIKAYFENQEKVKVECPPFIAESTKGKVTRYFEGRRLNYDFKKGTAWVDRKDIHFFRTNYPHFIIHDKEGAE